MADLYEAYHWGNGHWYVQGPGIGGGERGVPCDGARDGRAKAQMLNRAVRAVEARVEAALVDAIGLIEHLGGNPKVQRAAFASLRDAPNEFPVCLVCLGSKSEPKFIDQGQGCVDAPCDDAFHKES